MRSKGGGWDRRGGATTLIVTPAGKPNGDTAVSGIQRCTERVKQTLQLAFGIGLAMRFQRPCICTV